MATKKVGKHHTRRKGKRRNLNNREKMDICQWRDVGLTYNEIANRIQCSYQTVEYTLTHWAPKNPDRVKQARANALVIMAGQVGEKAQMALDALTPEMLVHDRVEVRNDMGDLVDVRHSGATGIQVANIADRMMAQQQNLMEKAQEIEEDLAGEGNETSTAEGIAALTAEILAQAKTLNISVDLGETKVVADEADYEDVTDGGGSGDI